jgi:hypothetical protein
MKQETLTEKEWLIFERGFEEGYAVAKRNYKIKSIIAYNENLEKVLVHKK